MTEQRRILGIDPGINGACALYLPDSTVPTMHGGLFDIPTVGEGKQREIDYAALRDLIFACRPTIAVIEVVNAFVPKRADGEGEEPFSLGGEEPFSLGNTSLFRFGGSYYAIHAVVACLDIGRHRASSPSWKGHFGLKGKPRGSSRIDDSARQVVLRRWPALQPFLKNKGHQHRAEAFLMAAWYAETGGRPARKPRSPKKADVRVPELEDDDIPE